MSMAHAVASEIASQDQSVRADEIIRLDNVQKIFYRGAKPTVALSNVSFNVRRGEFLAVVGPSGCGKSSILNLVVGLMSPSRGDIIYDGEKVNAVNTKTGDDLSGIRCSRGRRSKRISACRSELPAFTPAARQGRAVDRAGRPQRNPKSTFHRSCPAE